MSARGLNEEGFGDANPLEQRGARTEEATPTTRQSHPIPDCAIQNLPHAQVTRAETPADNPDTTQSPPGFAFTQPLRRTTITSPDQISLASVPGGPDRSLTSRAGALSVPCIVLLNKASSPSGGRPSRCRPQSYPTVKVARNDQKVVRRRKWTNRRDSRFFITCITRRRLARVCSRRRHPFQSAERTFRTPGMGVGRLDVFLWVPGRYPSRQRVGNGRHAQRPVGVPDEDLRLSSGRRIHLRGFTRPLDVSLPRTAPDFPLRRITTDARSHAGDRHRSASTSRRNPEVEPRDQLARQVPWQQGLDECLFVETRYRHAVHVTGN